MKIKTLIAVIGVIILFVISSGFAIISLDHDHVSQDVLHSTEYWKVASFGKRSTIYRTITGQRKLRSKMLQCINDTITTTEGKTIVYVIEKCVRANDRLIKNKQMMFRIQSYQ